MRKYDYPNPYEKLKDFTRGKAQVTKSEYLEFIDSLKGLPVQEIKMMKELTPQKYIGYASVMAKNLLKY